MLRLAAEWSTSCCRNARSVSSGGEGLQKARRRVAQVLHPLVVDGLDDGLSGREVAVERADSYPCPAGDLLDADVHLSGGDRRTGVLFRRADTGRD
jgi:hypothetical protein